MTLYMGTPIIIIQDEAWQHPGRAATAGIDPHTPVFQLAARHKGVYRMMTLQDGSSFLTASKDEAEKLREMRLKSGSCYVYFEGHNEVADLTI